MNGGSNADSAARTLAALGYGRIARALADRARTPGGGHASLNPQFAATFEEARRLLDETDAMARLVRARPDFAIEPLEDITGPLAAARKGARLDGAQLRAFVPLLRSGEAMRRALAEDDPALEPIRVEIPSVTGLADLLDESLEPDGAVRADATPEIERLTKSLASLRRAIREKAEAMLTDGALAPMLQDAYVTLRDNRFVLPVIAEHKSHVPGVIHDSSNTGQTYFIEPAALVEMNNRMRDAELELAREVERLLAELSGLVAAEADEIGVMYAQVCWLDAIHARALLALEHGMARPVFGQRVALRNLRHPLMLLDGARVVSNDIMLPEGAHALIISGPNTGGKTVALSALGLAALMARAGLFIAAAEGSMFPFYGRILADIGDSQSLAEGLSTFAGHVRAVNQVVEEAGPGSLALLDELMINTDPKEGGALAVAVADALIARGADVVVTTHFHELKILAQTDPRYRNVSLEFDAAAGQPTYRIIEGVPGESSALLVAERLNLDAGIVAAARGRLSGGDMRIERALEDLRTQKQEMERARRDMESAREEARRLREQAQRDRDTAEAARLDIERNARRKLNEAVAAARREIHEMVERTRAASGEKRAVKEALARLEQIAEEARRAGAPDERVPRGALRAGDLVYVIPLQKNGSLAADPAEGKAEVVVSGMRVSVTLEDLVGVGGKAAAPAGVKTAGETPREELPAAAPELNLIGMRAAEAVDALEKFLDTLFGAGELACRIIHGKGTGALRRAVHEHLAHSPYVGAYRQAEERMGGAGATEVELKPGGGA
ncbi:MAG: Smr/MutS family protein [Nitrospinae bacterium]|nr:Smr/MutS family protein [Nitrospinota bacterium]